MQYRVEHAQYSDTDEHLYTEIEETGADLEIATHQVKLSIMQQIKVCVITLIQNVAYLDIKSTRSKKVNHNAEHAMSREQDSAARSALGKALIHDQEIKNNIDLH